MTTNFNHPTHWKNQHSKQTRNDVITKTGQDALLGATDFLIGCTAAILSAMLNSISVIAVTDKWIGAAILAGSAAGLLVVHLHNRSIQSASGAEMKYDSQLSGHLNKSWDNILLGNELFYERWKARLHRILNNAESASLDLVRSKDKSVAYASFVTNLIVVGTALTLAWSGRSDKSYMIAIIVMLPRSLQIVNVLQMVQSYWARWKSLIQKLASVEESISLPKSVSLRQYIKDSEIVLTEHSIECTGSASQAPKSSPYNLDLLKSRRTGRFTIQGNNGVGKSTLMLELKKEFGTRAIYLPAHHHLEIEEDNTPPSTGQATMYCLNEIKNTSSEILLLDEWDANLSADNRKILDDMINTLSKDRLIVEVRHLNCPTSL